MGGHRYPRIQNSECLYDQKFLNDGRLSIGSFDFNVSATRKSNDAANVDVATQLTCCGRNPEIFVSGDVL